MSTIHVCPECDEPVRRKTLPRRGWALDVDADRLQWAHVSGGDALCPVMTSKGYQPAKPAKRRA